MNGMAGTLLLLLVVQYGGEENIHQPGCGIFAGATTADALM
jgi:hypothetical protein